MMSQISEQNRRWLQVYCSAARIFAGVILLIFGIVGIGYLRMMWSIPGPQGEAVGLMKVMTRIFWFMSYWALPLALPVFALGVTQLITYMLGEQERPGWMLRHLDKGLYLYASLLIVHKVRHLKQTAEGFIGGWVPYGSGFALYPLIDSIAIALALFGLGLLLRRVLSIIEESKTLV